MSKIKSSEKTELYKAFTWERVKHNENNDCTVVAIAATTGVTYDEAHAACAKFGRKQCKGMMRSSMHQALQSLGFELVPVLAPHIIAKYPGNHKNLGSVTTHHPARFNSVWRDGNNYLLHQKGHVSACVNGELHDWAVGRMKRVVAIYKVQKIGGGTPSTFGNINPACRYLAKVTAAATAGMAV